jgi:hypothetical protein
MPASGQQMCASGTGKQCPDGYHCMADTGAGHCFLDANGGAGGASSGAAGKGGVGGHAGGGGAATAGASGAAGAGGASGQQLCDPAFASTWVGQFSNIDSGGVPAPTYETIGGGFKLVESHTNTGAGTANIGVAFTFSGSGAGCVDASKFTGISFSISGTLSECSLLFQVDDTERSTGGNGGPSVSVNSVATTGQAISLPWSVTGGQPPGATDATRIAILIWGFSIPAGSPCMADIDVTNLTFY